MECTCIQAAGIIFGINVSGLRFVANLAQEVLAPGDFFVVLNAFWFVAISGLTSRSLVFWPKWSGVFIIDERVLLHVARCDLPLAVAMTLSQAK